MGVRIGIGFRPMRHVWIGASVPLRHTRRCLAHNGHGDADPVSVLIGAAIMWVVCRVIWGLAIGE